MIGQVSSLVRSGRLGKVRLSDHRHELFGKLWLGVCRIG